MTTTAIKERPILFSGEMVRAILDGTKTQTRRVMKPQPGRHWSMPPMRYDEGWLNRFGCQQDEESIRCPYGQPGDRLWVREAFEIIDDPAAQLPDEPPIEVPPDMGEYKGKPAIRRGPNGERWVVDYRADKNTRIKDRAGTRKWTPSIHMPRWASRITLEVTEVRVQRVQEISEDDAFAEGIENNIWDQAFVTRKYGTKDEWFQMWADDIPNYCQLEVLGRTSFQSLWDSINGKKPGHAWADNPFVWAVTFKKVAR